MIKTIFFDVGSVLLNEDWIHFKLYEMLWTLLRKQDSRWTFEALMAEREKRIQRQGDPRPDASIAREFLPSNDLKTYNYYVRYFSLRRRHLYLREMPGMRYVVHNLSPFYQLGIIANQPPMITDYLRRRGMLNYFRIVAISERLGMRKPEPAIFEWALQQAKTPPEAAVMIGDRVDHDVAPAKQLGMRTILARFDRKARGVLPQSYRERIYFDSLERVPNWRQQPRSRAEMPDAIVRTPEAILQAITDFEHSATRQVEESDQSLWSIIKEMLKEMAEVEVESPAGRE